MHFSDDFYCFWSDFGRFFPKKRKDIHNVSKYGGHLQSKLDYNFLVVVIVQKTQKNKYKYPLVLYG